MQVETTPHLRAAVAKLIEQSTGSLLESYDRLRVATQYVSTILATIGFTDKQHWDAPYRNWSQGPRDELQVIAWDKRHFTIITVDFKGYTTETPGRIKLSSELLPHTAVASVMLSLPGEGMYTQDGNSWDIDTDVTLKLEDGRAILFPWHYGNSENILRFINLLRVKG